MIDMIILDCDGVVIDSQILIQQTLKSSIDAVVKHNNASILIDDFLGMDLIELQGKIQGLSDVVINQSMIDHYYHDLYKTMERDLKPLLPNLIKKLHATNIKYCLASNSIRAQINYSLNLVGLKQYIADTQIFTIEQVARGKPEPDLFLFSALALNAQPQNCLVIEDSPSGIAAALSANMQVIAFLNGTHAQSKQYRDKIASYKIPIITHESELILFLEAEYGV
jgi:HAD superfamily hydrolase (TIGR01509 family)